MITLFLVFVILALFGSNLKFALKATWGIAKIILGVIVLPIVLIVFVLSGLLTLAVPILVIVGIVFLVKLLARANH